jgi:peptide/nickel transport system substrate-binding protein
MAFFVVLFTAACGASSAATKTSNSPTTGGKLTVETVASQWPGLDPASDTQDTADAAYLNAIFGQLFEMNSSNKIIPDEAQSWNFSKGNTVLSFTMRKGLKFSNGDPLTAADVAWSINRDLEPKWGNIGDTNFPFTSAGCSASGSVVTCPMKTPDVAILNAFVNEAPNWTVDETALNKMGESAYAQSPVGAGPFKVASNEASAQLNLVKNPSYWEKGHPYLSAIDFTAIGNDQSAVAALQAGQAQLAMGVTTIPLLKSIPSEGLVVTKLPAMVSEFVLFNTKSGPFANVKAREAAEYATDSSALVKGLYAGEFSTIQSQTASGQLFYKATNPNYHPYNLAKAKQLVSEIPGGLTVTLTTTTNTAFFVNEVQAIATMWQKAGIHVKIQDYTLQQMLNITFNGSWQAIDENWGVGTDPGINDSEFFAANAAFSGNKNATLNSLLNQGLATSSATTRSHIYTEVANVENQQSLAEFLYAKSAFFVTTKKLNVKNDFTANQFEIAWENMSLTS